MIARRMPPLVPAPHCKEIAEEYCTAPGECLHLGKCARLDRIKRQLAGALKQMTSRRRP